MQSINVQSPQLQKNKATPPKQSKCQLKFDYSPSADGIDYNLLILLHGLGNLNTRAWGVLALNDQ